jgi:peptide/nickel transport system substrate-binding protein
MKLLTIAKSGVPVTLDPASAQSSNELTIVGLAYETLLRVENVSGEYRIVSGLATKWETNEARDQWTFTLAKRRFSDGSLLHARTVIASLTRLKGLSSFASTRLRYIASFATLSNEIIVIKLTSAVRNFLFELTAPYASIISPTGLMVKADELARTTYGSGDFQVTHFDEVSLVMSTPLQSSKSDDAAVIKFVFIEDSTQRRIQLELNKLQLAENLSPTDIQQLSSNPDIHVVTTRSALLTYMTINCQRGPFVDIRLRKACASCLSLSSLKGIFGANATPLASIVPLGVYEGFGKIRHQADFESIDARILQRAFHDRPLRFLVDFPGEQSYWSDIATVLSRKLKSLGVRVEIERVTFADMRARLNTGDFDVTVVDWNLEYPDPAAVLDYWLHSEFTGLAGNVAGYSNKTVDRLLESARCAEPMLALSKLRESEAIALSDCAYIPLVQRHFHFAVRCVAKEIIRDDKLGWQGLSNDGIWSFFRKNSR